ncbi:MAG: hypothetical protein R2873_25470 [Caldilineaceae bacterium]
MTNRHFIEVHGAREQPQGRDDPHPQAEDHGLHRRLRLGKSSLVFDTIAAEAQRQLNETFTAFVQGFLPTWASPTWTTSITSTRPSSSIRSAWAAGRAPP